MKSLPLASSKVMPNASNMPHGLEPEQRTPAKSEHRPLPGHPSPPKASIGQPEKAATSPTSASGDTHHHAPGYLSPNKSNTVRSEDMVPSPSSAPGGGLETANRPTGRVEIPLKYVIPYSLALWKNHETPNTPSLPLDSTPLKDLISQRSSLTEQYAQLQIKIEAHPSNSGRHSPGPPHFATSDPRRRASQLLGTLIERYISPEGKVGVVISPYHGWSHKLIGVSGSFQWGNGLLVCQSNSI